MKKKLLTAVALTMAAITLVVATVFTTVAYLTASSAVSNVFTVGNVAITMYESKVNNDGTLADGGGKVDTNSYHLIPGSKYIKDPTIKITSTLEQDKMFLFVKSSNQIRQIEAGNFSDRQYSGTEGNKNRDNVTDLSMREQMERNGWVEFVRSGNGIEIVWVYGTRDEKGVIKPTAVGPTDTNFKMSEGKPDTTNHAGEFRLCEYFQVHKNVDVSIYASAKVTFTAFAIQSSGFATTNDTTNAAVKAAWGALKDTYPFEGGIASPINPYDKTAGAYDPVEGKEATFELLTPPANSNSQGGTDGQ